VLSLWFEAREALALKRREFITLLGSAALVPDSKGLHTATKIFDVIHRAA
jgi:hypothetical protein